MTASVKDSSTHRIQRIGIIGCGQVAQVVHIPTLGFLSDYFSITYLCDVSTKALAHCQSRVVNLNAPKTTSNPEELCSSDDVDVVFVLSSDEYHAQQAILALKYDKLVFVEKPLALNVRDLEEIQAAEASSQGKVMVGYMRRYATAFEDALQEIGGLDKILYARVRGQSGTFPKAFDDLEPKDAADRGERARQLLYQALEVECDVPVTDSNSLEWRLLGGLGTHDISAMREVIGMPLSVLGVSLGFPFWNVLFQYPGFAVSYESGLNSVPRFDAHIEVYGQDKSVRIQYDTPYVKGLPVTLHISENVNGSLKETTIRRTYEDPYTLEMKKLYAWATEGNPIKTTVEDARQDLHIFQMIIKAGSHQNKAKRHG